MPKSVLIIGERFFPEEFLVNEVVAELLQQGFSVSVLTQQPSYPFGKIFEGYKNRLFFKDEFQGATVYRTAFVPGYHKSVVRKILNYLTFVCLGILYVLIKIPRHDKILVYQTGPLTQALIGVAAKIKFRRPLHIWTWDIWPDSVFAYGFKKKRLLSALLNSFVRSIYRRADYIWVSSPGFSDVICKYAKAETPFHFIPNWVQNVSPMTQHAVTFEPGINFTFTGNIGKVQNLDQVILGFSLALNRLPLLKLNLVGDGSALDELKQLVALHKIPNVHFWGRQPLATMDALYAQSDALVISLAAASVWGLYIPSKFQSYLLAQKPILGVINGAVSDMITQYEVGVCADPASVEAIAEGIVRISGLDLEKRTKMTENAQNLSNSIFDRRTNLDKIIQLLSA